MPIPQVRWFKDGMSIENNPDYLVSYENGACSLTIEETFTEDSAVFTCQAWNSAGQTETCGSLRVKGMSCHSKIKMGNYSVCFRVNFKFSPRFLGGLNVII